jgi:hypothetical protein
MKTKLFISSSKNPKTGKHIKTYEALYTALNKTGEEILDKAKTENDVFDILTNKKIEFCLVLKIELLNKL